MSPIRFGTDGWRAVISEDYTFANVRTVAQAIADYAAAAGVAGKGMVVGFDTRFLSDRYAQAVAGVLAANGIGVMLTEGCTPTPAVSWAVKEAGAGGAVMVTASHNPPEYNGIKLKADFAGPALPEQTAWVERILDENLAQGREPRGTPFEESLRTGEIRRFDARPAYGRQLRSLVFPGRFNGSGLRVVVDVMHGAARGYLPLLLAEAGVEVHEIRGELNPGFGGTPPEPIERNLRPLIDAVKALGADLGLATDGDGDRIGAVDANGNFVDAQRIFALLLEHLVEHRGWTGSVVKTFAGSRMVDRLAAGYGLKFYETPVGFKHVCELALKEEVLIGGEESGGIGVRNHMPERDGILCGLLLVEIVATRGPLAEIVDRLMDKVGFHCFARHDLPLTPKQKDRLLTRLKESPLHQIAGFQVEALNPLDGFKFLLGEHGWVLFRPSGTEPVVRVYAEADNKDKLSKILAAGREFAHGQ